MKKILKTIGARTQPCFTPLLIAKASVTFPLERTCPVMSSWKSLIIDKNFGEHPMCSRTVHRASLLTVSKALVRSMKTKNRRMFCSMHFSWSCLMAKIMSTVLFPGPKPHCASGRFCSETVMSLLRITLANIFPVIERREMPL